MVSGKGKVIDFYRGAGGAPDSSKLADRWRVGGERESDQISGLQYVNGVYTDPAIGWTVGTDARILAKGDTNPNRDHGDNVTNTKGGFVYAIQQMLGRSALGGFISLSDRRLRIGAPKGSGGRSRTAVQAAE